ncbi:MAG: N-acetylmuramoyl-L-alanine amidase-like domain-containing protein [Chitinivibrionales bacterium]
MALIQKASLAITLIFISIMFLLLSGYKHTNQNQKPKATSNASTFGIPEIPDSFRLAMSRYQNTRGAELEDWGPDGKGVVVLKRGDQTNQIFFVEKPGADPRQLTYLSEPTFNAAICPDSSRKCVLFEQDSLGNENFQIYSLNMASLKVMPITDNSFQNLGVVWSNHGDRFAFQSNRRNGKDYDLYISDITNPEKSTCVLTKGGDWSICDWSSDDKQLLVSHYISRTESYLFILNIKTDSLVPLHQFTETVSEEIGAFGPDDKGVFFTSDKGGAKGPAFGPDFRSLRYLDFSTKKETLLTSSIRWDVGEIALSKKRDALAFSINEDGFTRIYLMNAKTLTFKPLPNLPKGIINRLRFHPSGKMLAMSIKTPRQPESVYAIDLDDFSLTQWTYSEMGGLDTNLLSAPEIIHYATFDSVRGKPRLVPCFFFKPSLKKPPFPVLIMVHGGPESQYWPSFSPSVQFYVHELGMAMLAPNVRGSSGYGKTYLSLDNGMKRENAVRDIGALLDWVENQPGLDASRVAVMGGSYGGYMALASMVHFSNRLRAGIDIYGISNFLTYLKHTASYRRDLRRVEYGDERDPAMRDFLLRISPVTQASGITKPLLIIQGANDPRVPAEESRQIAEAMQKNKGIVWMSIAADEGHGYRKKSNIDFQELVEAYFLKTFLKPVAPLPTNSILWEQVTPKDKETINALFDSLKSRSASAQRISFCSKYFLGKRYDRTGPTGEGIFDTCDPKPLYNIRSFDCVTYIEHVLALALSKDSNQFMPNLIKLRYTGGHIDYLHRNHFFVLDWLPNNSALLSMVPPPKGRTVQRAISKKDFFSKIGLHVDCPDTILKLTTWTPEEIGAVIEQRSLQPGVYIFVFILRVNPNLDANHVGFMIVEKDTTHFRCASKLHGIVAELDFASYLQEFGFMLEGVLVAQLKNDVVQP